MKINPNIIPMMIDPLSTAWDQPDYKGILIDDESAVMSKDDFTKLKNYSHSQPSGVYAGKMWKIETRDGRWILCWYGHHKNPDMCSNNERWILLI